MWEKQRKLSSLLYKIGIALYEQDILGGDILKWLGIMPQYIENISDIIRILQNTIEDNRIHE